MMFGDRFSDVFGYSVQFSTNSLSDVGSSVASNLAITFILTLRTLTSHHNFGKNAGAPFRKSQDDYLLCIIPAIRLNISKYSDPQISTPIR